VVNFGPSLTAAIVHSMTGTFTGRLAQAMQAPLVAGIVHSAGDDGFEHSAQPHLGTAARLLAAAAAASA